jgi:fatty acid desaturase
MNGDIPSDLADAREPSESPESDPPTMADTQGHINSLHRQEKTSKSFPESVHLSVGHPRYTGLERCTGVAERGMPRRLCGRPAFGLICDFGAARRTWRRPSPWRLPTSTAMSDFKEPQVTPEPASPRGSDYAELSRQVRQAGLLDRRPAYYAWKITLTAAALVLGWAAFAAIGNSWWQLADAVFLAVAFAQIGFLGHDAGHSQVFRSRRANTVLGVACGNLATGVSYDWWSGKHNRHHAHPNTEGADPDIMIGVLAFSAARARAGRGIQRLIFRYQAYLLVPMLFLEALGLHASSIRTVTGPGCRHRAWEATLLAVHFAAYLGAVFFVLSPVKAVVFILVQQGLLGFYLGASFAPNHKGMPILAASDKTDFLRRQVLTSRNVHGGWLTDFALGGLNYQIEHHLFPSMPRPNLCRAQGLVAAYCAEHEVSYAQTSLIGSYAQALGHLAAVGRLTGPATVSQPAPVPAQP